jgi:aldose 1-epimerase
LADEAHRTFVLRAAVIEATLTNCGAALVSLRVPDAAGETADVVLGFDSPAEYLGEHPYLGVIVGRCAGRIGGARFRLGGAVYPLTANEGPNQLHGGVRHFGRVVWTAGAATERSLELRHFSPHGDEGYPGNLEVKVVYSVDDPGQLRIDYEATTDRDTVVNLTSHSYFNLAGHGEGDVRGHELTIPAESITALGPGLIPTGERRPVAGTPFDFRRPAPIGARIDDADEQLALTRGYDHNFVLDGERGTLRPAARAVEPRSGRVLEILTTEPGLQFYSGNFLDGSLRGKGGRPYHRRSGFCLETQGFPDSPNQPGFPSVVLERGATYRSTTVHRFGWRR